MTLKPVLTKNAPAPIGPYNQAIICQGTIVYTAGQIPIDPATGKFVPGGIREQTDQVFKNLAAILEAAGASLATVVKTTVFLKNMSEFAAMNEVYGKYMTGTAPARSTVEVARLPKDALVEIEAIALVPEGGIGG